MPFLQNMAAALEGCRPVFSPVDLRIRLWDKFSLLGNFLSIKKYSFDRICYILLVITTIIFSLISSLISCGQEHHRYIKLKEKVKNENIKNLKE